MKGQSQHALISRGQRLPDLAKKDAQLVIDDDVCLRRYVPMRGDTFTQCGLPMSMPPLVACRVPCDTT